MGMNKKIQQAINLLKNHGAKFIKIFSSYARCENTPHSDLEVIVKFKNKKSLLELIAIKQEIEEKLKIKIDLLTSDSISPYLTSIIKNEVINVI